MVEFLLNDALPVIVTFLIGLVIKSPFFQRYKIILKALEDGKLTKEEIAEIREAIK